MSSTTMLCVPAVGPMMEIAEFQNSWGSAMRVWDAMATRYYPGQPVFFAMDSKRFWGLKDDPRLTECERLAFVWTFDRAICEREHANDLADALCQFNSMYPVNGKANHLPAIADALKSHAMDECVGLAFIQTSVSSDVWDLNDECPDLFHSTGIHDEDSYCPTCDNDATDPTLCRRFAWDKDKDSDEYFLLFAEYGNNAEKRTIGNARDLSTEPGQEPAAKETTKEGDA